MRAVRPREMSASPPLSGTELLPTRVIWRVVSGAREVVAVGLLEYSGDQRGFMGWHGGKLRVVSITMLRPKIAKRDKSMLRAKLLSYGTSADD